MQSSGNGLEKHAVQISPYENGVHNKSVMHAHAVLEWSVEDHNFMATQLSPSIQCSTIPILTATCS